MTRAGVPEALQGYVFIGDGERALYHYLCVRANVHGEVADVSQRELAKALKADERTVRRWTASLARLRLLRAERLTVVDRYLYTLRPPTAWISDRASGFVSAEELRAQLGEPVTREQLDAWKAAADLSPSDSTVPDNCPVPTGHLCPLDGDSIREDATGESANASS